MAFRSLLIFSIIDFTVAAPVLVQQKPRSDVYVVHTTEHAKTKLGKRGDELDDLVFKLIGYDPESHPPARPEEPPALRPSGPTDVPSTSNEPSQVAIPGHAQPVPYNDALNNLWFDPYVHRFPDDPLAAHPSWGSPSSGPDPGLEGVEKPVPSIPNELSLVVNPGHAPPVPGNDASNNLLLDLNEPPQVASLDHAPPVPGNDASNNLWFDLNEPPLVASPDHAPPVPGNDASNNPSFDPYVHRFPDDSLAARPPWASQPSGPSHGWTDVEKPLSVTPDETPVTD
jgi:hypothetical protein